MKIAIHRFKNNVPITQIVDTDDLDTDDLVRHGITEIEYVVNGEMKLWDLTTIRPQLPTLNFRDFYWLYHDKQK